MKSSILVQLAVVGLGAAFVIPDEQLFNLRHVDIDDASGPVGDIFDKVKTDFEHYVEHISDNVQQLGREAGSVWDRAFEAAPEVVDKTADNIRDTYAEAKNWLHECAAEDAEAFGNQVLESLEPLGRHGHHDKKPNQTVYELIASSNYTKTLAKLINEYPDLVEALNGTSANFTVFAPTDRAFDKIPKHAPKPSKEELKYILSYHVSPDFYPAGRILISRTIPTLLKSEELGKKPRPQRLNTNIGFRGLTVNFYSRVTWANYFGTNGVIHGVDSILVPPPRVLEIIDILPGEFSTLELGLVKTGLWDELNSTDTHEGGTLFAPSNHAFEKLGHSTNAFLFSKYGRKYLKALLKYHIAPGNTIYSDAFYKASATEETAGIPKGVFHVDLPTLLKDKRLGVDIARYGRLIEIKINAFSRVTVGDGVAKDGVIHGVSDVLIPPKKLSNGQEEAWDGGRISVEDLVERLEALAEDETHGEDL